jgi:hypothetical protein
VKWFSPSWSQPSTLAMCKQAGEQSLGGLVDLLIFRQGKHTLKRWGFRAVTRLGDLVSAKYWFSVDVLLLLPDV